MTVRLAPKLPTEKRSYRHDWSNFLGADTIATQSTTSAGVTISADAIETGDKSITWEASGGTLGEAATITQTITTAAGLTETETFVLPITADDVLSLTEVKAYLRVRSSDEDAKIAAMIPRARLWVEDHTGLALLQREFVERRRTEAGAIRLFKGPLVSVDSVTYGSAETYTPRSFPPDTRLVAASDTAWPSLDEDDAFEITYTAGYAVGQVDDRLLGAMLALVEGEYDAGYAYPDEAVKAAELCCGYLRAMVA